MQRIEIRNLNSNKPTKPRMFDALIGIPYTRLPVGKAER